MIIPSDSTRLLLQIAAGSAEASEELRAGLRDSVRALRQAKPTSKDEGATRRAKTPVHKAPEGKI